MWDDVGLIRTGAAMERALARIRSLRAEAEDGLALPDDRAFNLALLDWFELRAALLVAESVAVAALARKESRGAHQREDCPQTLDQFERNQTVALDGDRLVTGWIDVHRHAWRLEDKKVTA
jgi:succinate dehydrogenase/fumarate reductase flavoprotein subunit